ncbi:hypothetical protein BS50DRAFT_618648 [Corynespora cassiicola Philippines]|uniref:Rhodopsin domain-containing protein n=1 Tax=Corynespora cassiicola Philippines TaxID=1448308 RepID=A0A2T2NVZ7_CORCC|nr:hypothetical protein BS50DRAFT_618648 [Corynespora cassiicola Philippines]
MMMGSRDTTSNNKDVSDTIVVVVISIFILSLTMLLRLYTRLRVMKKFSWEDGVICGSFLLIVPIISLSVPAVRLGILRKSHEVSRHNASQLSKLIYVHAALCIPCLALSKISILLQMIRIFIPCKRTPSWYAMVIFTWFNTIWFIGAELSSIFQCSPIKTVWHPEIRGQCINLVVRALMSGVFNIISDITMLVLPMFWISRLRLDLRKKITAALVFIVGLLACVASILRVAFTAELAQRSNHSDPTSRTLVSACVAAEAAAAIICANLPTLPAFIRHTKSKGFVFRHEEHGNGGFSAPHSNRTIRRSNMYALTEESGIWSRQQHQSGRESVPESSDAIILKDMRPAVVH